MSYRMLGDGRRQVVDFHLPGEFLGLEAGVEYSLTAQAVTPAKVVALGRRRLATLAAEEAVTQSGLGTPGDFPGELFMAVPPVEEAKACAALVEDLGLTKE